MGGLSKGDAVRTQRHVHDRALGNSCWLPRAGWMRHCPMNRVDSLDTHRRHATRYWSPPHSQVLNQILVVELRCTCDTLDPNKFGQGGSVQKAMAADTEVTQPVGPSSCPVVAFLDQSNLYCHSI